MKQEENKKDMVHKTEENQNECKQKLSSLLPSTTNVPQNTHIFKKKAFENVLWKMLTILFRYQNGICLLSKDSDVHEYLGFLLTSKY